MMLMLNVPATVGLIVLAEPIVALIYQRGEFKPADTAGHRGGADVLRAGAARILGGEDRLADVLLAARQPHSGHRQRTSVLANLVLNLALVRVHGLRGLALGTAIAAMFNALMLLWLLRRRLGGLDGRRVAVPLAKITSRPLVMGVVALRRLHALDRSLPGDAE